MKALRLLYICSGFLICMFIGVAKNANAQTVKNHKSEIIKNRIEQSFTIEKTRKNIRVVGDGTIAKPQIELKDEIIRLPASPLANAQKDEATRRILKIEQMEVRHYKKPLILSAGRFQSSEKLVQIANIIPTELEKICLSKMGDWPCGKFARAQLRRLVRGNTINCVSPDGVTKLGEFTIEESCEVSNFEIAKWLITNGWADSNHANHKERRDIAKAKGLGIWRKN